MICTHPISHSLERLVTLTEQLLDLEIIIKRLKETPYRGMLLDPYTYDTNETHILVSTAYLGMLKDFVIARHCMTLLLKGSAFQTGNLKVLSYNEESAYRGMKQIYLDILKEDSECGRKIETPQLLRILFQLYTHFYETCVEVPWDIIVNRWLYQHCPRMRKAQMYYLIKEGKRDMAALLQFKESLPKKFFVMNKAMFYARDLYLADVLPSYDLMPVKNIPQMQKFEHLEVKEMLTTRWTKSSWYKTKLVGDRMKEILEENVLSDNENLKDTAYFNGIFNQGVAVTDLWCSYMHMDTWFTWAPPEVHRVTDARKEEIEESALRQIFGDLI
jgi:hypothetical protein